MSAAISTLVLFRSLRPARPRACPGLRNAGCGRTTAMSRAPVTSSFLIGMMEARTAHPTMWGLWRRWRMAASTPWRATPVIPCARTAILLGTMRFMGTEPLLINSLKKEEAQPRRRLGTYIIFVPFFDILLDKHLYFF